MENRSDYEKRLGEKLEAAYMLEDIGPGMSREEFHRIILAAEKKKKRRRSLLGLAAACVALCLVCGGFVAGMTMRESASAGKDDKTKTVQQGGSVVIGSGVSENGQNVGVSTKTYTDIQDIPEVVRKEIHFLDSDEFKLEKVKVTDGKRMHQVETFYRNRDNKEICIIENSVSNRKDSATQAEDVLEYNGIKIYTSYYDNEICYCFVLGKEMIQVSTTNDIKIEVILDDLLK